jgi:hypothetical protein
MKFYSFWSKVVALFTRKAQEGSEEVYERYDLEEWPEVEQECYIFRYDSPNERRKERMKSIGHILFAGDYEYFRRNGHIYKAIKFNPVQVDGYRLGRIAATYKEEEY